MKYIINTLIALAALNVVYSESPASVNNLVFTLTATNGTGRFVSSGSFNLLPHKSDNRFWITALNVGGADSKGTYTYTKTGADTGEILMNDTTFGVSYAVAATWITEASGTYTLSGSSGTQTGAFTMDYRFNQNEIESIGVGDIFIKANGTNALELDFAIKRSDDLSVWNNTSGTFIELSPNIVRWIYTPTSGNQFFSIHIEPNF